ncbi:lipid-A-disaccharide synthase [Dialister sp.]|uniref:lipid-A-disaccharide synthase n=1 Tax=Dialister sp. TaxID=1955814 RepID=UPI002E811FB5|nr:lipid-A-disaccharide synthase [Dialister sp.]MEE3452853.1 lipid-A-disaccharide synthase [Dialister sp.]
MKIMMSAGEASGDMHAASVAAEIKRIRPDAEIFGMGGELMKKSGVRIIYDIENLGIIGVVEVIKHIPFFFRLRDLLRQAMIDEKPDVLVCVDYPGFNMKIAHVAKTLGIPVVYYIAPTIWAWNKGRAKNIVRDVAQVASIFPFEAKAYKEAGAHVTFVGHPLADTVKPSMSFEEALDYFHGNQEARRILLMPGSRKNEVTGLFPLMLEAAENLSKKENCQFFIPRASTIPKEFLLSFMGNRNISFEITEGHQYDLMQICDVCVASSGTATLETALMELPTVLVYKLAPLTWFLANLLVHVKYAGLPNLLMGREVTPELLQDRATAGNVTEILQKWLTDESARQENISEIRKVREALGSGGAVNRTAKLILETAGAANGEK